MTQFRAEAAKSAPLSAAVKPFKTLLSLVHVANVVHVILEMFPRSADAEHSLTSNFSLLIKSSRSGDGATRFTVSCMDAVRPG